MKNFFKIKCCRICKNKSLEEVVDLKKQFIQGSFIKKNFPIPYSYKIPLKLLLCKKCFLVQTSHTVNKSLLYSNYWYSSGINSTMKIHLNEIANETRSYFSNKKKVKVLDIGCNDGTLLNFFKKNTEKYGIDPSQIIKKIDKNKVKTFNDFFPPKKNSFKKLKIKFNIITSIAMFYDIDDPNLFTEKIKFYLEKKGIWVFELSYLIDMINQNSFDTICHEHLEYYSITTINYLLKKNELKLFKISRNNINGGSIRCYVTHYDNDLYDNKKNLRDIDYLIKNEKLVQVNTKKYYINFNKKILRIKNVLKKKIIEIKKRNKKIYILGASTKGNTILQYLGIDYKLIPYAVERNKNKIGASTIGSKIKIIGEDLIRKNPPDYMLVLPWHFKKEIVNREKSFIKNGGALIFPLPKVHIVNKKNLKVNAK